jgi:hypothetical protein
MLHRAVWQILTGISDEVTSLSLGSYIPEGKKVKQSLYTPWRRLGGEEI